MIVIYIIFDTTANNNGRRQTSVIKDITHHTTYRGLPVRSPNGNSILAVKHLGKQIGAFYNLFVKYKGFFNIGVVLFNSGRNDDKVRIFFYTGTILQMK